MDEVEKRRKINEKKFGNWDGLPEGGRKYRFEIKGKFGYFARYVKEVNSEEKTTHFYQEIYDSGGELVGVHFKYPVDEGHKILKERKR